MEVHFKHEPKRLKGKTVIKNGMETEGEEKLWEGIKRRKSVIT
jgi:hypothetical protein